MAKRPAKAPIKAAQPVPAAADEPHDAGEPLDNARHERFAQALAVGKTATDAYEDAGFKADKTGGASSRLLSGNVRIQDRVRFLQGRAADATGVTLETLTAQLQESFRTAIIFGQPGAAVSACRLLAEMYGLIGAGDNKNAANGSVVVEEIRRVIVWPKDRQQPGN